MGISQFVYLPMKGQLGGSQFGDMNKAAKNINRLGFVRTLGFQTG
jgi:hypothetical protein